MCLLCSSTTYGVLQCCRRATLSVSVPHRTCLTVYALPGVVLLYKVTWEFWTNSNDECGPLCDKQKKFVRVRLLLKTAPVECAACGALALLP